MSNAELQMIDNDTAEDEAFVFPQGIAGFSDATRFGFIYAGGGEMVCLQSIDCPEAAFILTTWDESRLGSVPKLSQEQKQCLQLAEGDDLMWMVVLNPFADQAWVTANQRAPIAINASSRKGVQCIRHEEGLALRYPWMPQPAGTLSEQAQSVASKEA